MNNLIKHLHTEIIAHLGSAVAQSSPTDDQIIMEHVRTALTLARALRAERENDDE